MRIVQTHNMLKKFQRTYDHRMSSIAKPVLDVNMMATILQQMLKSQEQLQLMVAAHVAQQDKQEHNNQ